MVIQTNLKNQKLELTQEFKLIYSGPTFESGIKINSLIENLKSIQELIQSITDVNAEDKQGYNSAKNIKEIKVIPKKGSIEEQIVVLFSNPEIRSTVTNLLVALFFYLLGRHEAKKSQEELENKIDRVENLIVKNQLKNVKKLYEPLENEKDTLKIVENNLIKFEINFTEKKQIDKTIKKLEKELKTEVSDEEIEGYISAIDIDTNRLKFHAKGQEKASPLDFDQPMTTVTKLIGRVIKAKMTITKFKEKIRRFQLNDYKVIQKDLAEFIKSG